MIATAADWRSTSRSDDGQAIFRATFAVPNEPAICVLAGIARFEPAASCSQSNLRLGAPRAAVAQGDKGYLRRRVETSITPTLRVEATRFGVWLVAPISANSVVRADWAIGARNLA